MLAKFGRPSHATLVAYAALFIALGGVSYAADVLPKNSVGSAQIKRGAVKSTDLAKSAVTGGKVKDGTLLSSDFKPGQLPSGAPGGTGPQGPPGPAGEKGDTGAPGTPATRLWAKVTSTGSLQYGVGATSATQLAQGAYEVSFGTRDLASCVGQLTIGWGHPGASGDAVAFGSTGWIDVKANSVLVGLHRDNTGTGSFSGVDNSFHLVLFCP